MTTDMAREIAEQPAVLERTLDRLLERRDEIRQLARDRAHVLLVARGTSDNAALYGRYLFEIHAGRGATSAAPSLATHYGVERDLRDTLVVSLSQSGETSEIVETQAWAVARGARTIAITNGADSSLAAQADVALVTPAGAEVAVPATKSYTAQLAGVAIVADALGPTGTPLEAELRRVPAEVARLIETRAGVAEAVEQLVGSDTTLVSGRGVLFGTSLEVALKLEETCLRPVRGLSYADLRHGPIAVVDERAAVILVAAPDGPMASGMAELARDIAELGAWTIGIGGDLGFQTACAHVIEGPDLSELVAPLAMVVPAQLMVESLARELGLDPDAPRGLSKVTQTDPSGPSDPFDPSGSSGPSDPGATIDL